MGNKGRAGLARYDWIIGHFSRVIAINCILLPLIILCNHQNRNPGFPENKAAAVDYLAVMRLPCAEVDLLVATSFLRMRRTVPDGPSVTKNWFLSLVCCCAPHRLHGAFKSADGGAGDQQPVAQGDEYGRTGERRGEEL